MITVEIENNRVVLRCCGAAFAGREDSLPDLIGCALAEVSRDRYLSSLVIPMPAPEPEPTGEWDIFPEMLARESKFYPKSWATE